MSKTVINKREQLKWNNGFDPNGKSIPDITESDEGKFIKVVDGVLAFGEGGGSGSTYTAGDNIQISAENVISATDTTYTAGTNVSISNENVISATNTTYTAGTNISISAQNEISATDTTYSAGTGISIDGSNVISADSQLPTVSSSDEGKVLKVDSNGDWSVGTDDNTTYTAGTNVSISAQNVISATDTTYSAGEGIEISAQVVSSPDAVMAKEGIADVFKMSFYPIPDSTTDTPSLTDGFVRLYNVKETLNQDWVCNPYKLYSVTGTIYACIVNSYTYYDQTYTGYRILFIQPNVQGSYGGQVHVKTYRVSDEQTSDSGVANLWQTYTSDGVNFAYGAFWEANGYARYEEVSDSLSDCVYASDTEALAAFAALYPNNLPTLPTEGAQVWKDGKLQTYTSGSWVDSDTIVEQIATASEKELPSYSSSDNGKVLSVDSNGDLEWATSGGGGGGSETWTPIATNISANWNWGDYRDIINKTSSDCPTSDVWNHYNKIAIVFKQDPGDLEWCYPRQTWLRENNNGSTQYSTPKVIYGVKLPSGDWSFETIGVAGEDTYSNPSKWGSSSVSCYFEPNPNDDPSNPRWGLTARFNNFVYNDGTTNNGLSAIIGTVTVYGIS